MALYNESLEGRFNQAIQKLHGMRGPTPAPQVSPELGHQLILENDRPETYKHLQTDLFVASGLINAGAAGTFAFAGVHNPVASGLLVIVTLLEVNDVNFANRQFSVYVAEPAPAPFNTSQTTFYRDSRGGRKVFSGQPVQLVSDNTQLVQPPAGAGVQGPVERISAVTGAIGGQSDTVPYVLIPGSALLAQVQTAVTPFVINVAGYSRPLGSSDLTT
jgi:hypothetical protein